MSKPTTPAQVPGLVLADNKAVSKPKRRKPIDLFKSILWCHLYHRWNAWGDSFFLEGANKPGYGRYYQERSCKRCNKTVRRVVSV